MHVGHHIACCSYIIVLFSLIILRIDQLPDACMYHEERSCWSKDAIEKRNKNQVDGMETEKKGNKMSMQQLAASSSCLPDLICMQIVELHACMLDNLISRSRAFRWWSLALVAKLATTTRKQGLKNDDRRPGRGCCWFALYISLLLWS